MKTRNLAALAAVAALAGVATTASAQTNGPTGFSARLGIFLPTQDNVFSSTIFNFGVDYKLTNFNVRSPGEGLQAYVGLTADYYYGNGSSNLPLAVTYNVRSGNIVYHAGIGVDFYDIDDTNDTGTGIGGQVGIAYEFGNAGRVDKPLFVQAKYFLTRKSELNGFGVYLGYRF